MSNCIYDSFVNCKKYNKPWVHYETTDILDSDLLDFIYNFKFPTNEEIITAPVNFCTLRKFEKISALLKGEQYKQTFLDERHSCEINFTQTFRQQHVQAQRLFEMFLDKKVISYLENTGNVSLKDSFLRIQLLKDIDGYTVTPHIDYEKIFTLQCFFMTNTESDIGTILLSKRNGDIIKRTQYHENAGTFFFPTKCTQKNIPMNNTDEMTWHSFYGKINVQRISLMVNFFSSIPLGNNAITNKDVVFYKL